MTDFSDYAENAVINHLLRNTALTSPTTVYAALSTADPTDAGSGLAEPSGNGYARTAITFNAPSGGVSDNAVVTFPAATGSWGTITHFAIFDASSGGNMLFHSALAASKAVGDGDTAEFAAGDMTVTLT